MATDRPGNAGASSRFRAQGCRDALKLPTRPHSLAKSPSVEGISTLLRSCSAGTDTKRGAPHDAAAGGQRCGGVILHPRGCPKWCRGSVKAPRITLKIIIHDHVPPEGAPNGPEDDEMAAAGAQKGAGSRSRRHRGAHARCAPRQRTYTNGKPGRAGRACRSNRANLHLSGISIFRPRRGVLTCFLR